MLPHKLSRRGFLATAAASTVCAAADTGPKKIYVVPNFHPASCGWLANFSKERVYCANSYLDHLDRVRDDPHYEFVMSEVNNIIAIGNFQPRRIPELHSRVKQGRVELVNGFFLESAINLSGGEALVRLGVDGLRWQEKMFGVRPRFAWTIDVCGTHDQMAQIASGLGLEAMVFTRKNPTGKTILWAQSPDGSRVLTLSPGHYSEAGEIFSTKEALTAPQLAKLKDFFDRKTPITPEGAPILILGGSGDYALAPSYKKYPSEFIQQWAKAYPDSKIQFTTLSKYLDAVAPGVKSGHIQIPTMPGGTAYDFDAFWIENPRVKHWYRRDEHALQAAEILSTAASLDAKHAYPVQLLYNAWVLMHLNMDRNTLWGSAGGMVFVSDTSWDVQDRFEWVHKTAHETLDAAGGALLPRGNGVGLFNPLNWKRDDPFIVDASQTQLPENVECQKLPDGSKICRIELPAMSIGGWKSASHEPSESRAVEMPETIETHFYQVRINPKTGGISSLKLKSSGREVLGGEANVIIAEKSVGQKEDPGDFTAPRERRQRVGSTSENEPKISVSEGPLATIVEVAGSFYGGGPCRRVVRFYRDHPRIDFETELNDIPDKTVVVAEFPLADDILETRRGIPYGFSHGAWSHPNPQLHGWTKGIVPAVRWSHYALASGGGVAILDRGLTGRELTGRTPIIFLYNASDKYYGYPNSWLSGKGKHVLSYAFVAHEDDWKTARIPRMAWEYNRAPVILPGQGEKPPHSFIETSDNVIVEAMRREGSQIELRFVECLGYAGTAEVKLSLPHSKAALTDLLGRHPKPLRKAVRYRFPVRPQQIVTMRFDTSSAVPEPALIHKWDEFVPPAKLAALHAYSSDKGHPPRGD